MKRLFLILIFILKLVYLQCQNSDTLYINYIVHAPFAFKEGDVIKGVEIDLVKEYVSWLKSKKNMTVIVKYSAFSNYQALYKETRLKERKSFGLASAIISQDKNSDVEFSLPYIKNVAFCITNGNAIDIKVKNQSEVIKALGSMTALTISNTSLNKYILEIKKTFIPDLKINYFESESKIMDEISKNILSFAYVDAITFWNYLKNNPSKFIKMQRVLSQSKEEIGLILPKGCPHNPLFKEFFIEFKTTSAYRVLLEKYLGAYMTQNVALN